MPHEDQSERTAGYVITSTLCAEPLALIEVQRAAGSANSALVQRQSEMVCWCVCRLSVSGIRDFLCCRKDGPDEANSRLSQFYEGAQKLSSHTRTCDTLVTASTAARLLIHDTKSLVALCRSEIRNWLK